MKSEKPSLLERAIGNGWSTRIRPRKVYLTHKINGVRKWRGTYEVIEVYVPYEDRPQWVEAEWAD